MSQRTFVVVGGNAAGMSAASVAKRRDPTLDVVVFEQGERISYAACGIPYWVAGVSSGPDALVSVTPEEARRERGVDLRLGWLVERVDAGARTVRARDASGREVEVAYDDLLLATGCEPEAPFAVEPLEGLFVVRHLENGAAMRAFLDAARPSRAVIVGGGYVGVEMAEAFVARGLRVTMVLRRRRTLGESLDEEMSDRVLAALERAGVEVVVAQATGVVGDARVEAVRTTAGDLPADVAVLATGVKARSDLARQAGCALADRDAVVVDRAMRTSVPHVYAAGDCATVWHRLLDRQVFLPLALGANRGGRVAGENVAGGRDLHPGVLGTAITRFFEWEVARTGLTEVEATAAGFDAVARTIEENAVAGYMPGASQVAVRLVLERGSGRLLGGQLVGGPGSGKRVDALATAIHAGLTASDLEEVDLAYAPPFSPVYDPLLIAARIAGRVSRSSRTASPRPPGEERPR